MCLVLLQVVPGEATSLLNFEMMVCGEILNVDEIQSCLCMLSIGQRYNIRESLQ